MAIAESLDQFVVPVDDIVVAEDFYVQVFGGQITKRNGLNTRQRKRGAVPRTFIQIGGKRGLPSTSPTYQSGPPLSISPQKIRKLSTKLTKVLPHCFP